MCIKHSAISVLHCSFRFLISFGVGDKTQQVAKAIPSSFGFSPRPRYVLYTSVVRHFYMKSGLIIIILVGLVSCRTTEITGRYELQHFPKTSIELKDDGTFEFTKINPNPYLHSFDHPEDYYFITTGTWSIKKHNLILNSSQDSLTLKTPDVMDSKEDLTKVDTAKNIFGEMWTPRSYSTFTFHDIFGDTVNVLSGKSPDISEIFRLHRSMKSLYWSTVWSDTLEFHFYGYRPYQFIRTDKVRKIVNVRLYPARQGGVFSSRQFVMKRNRIKDHKIRFDKKRPHNKNYRSVPGDV